MTNERIYFAASPFELSNIELYFKVKRSHIIFAFTRATIVLFLQTYALPFKEFELFKNVHYFLSYKVLNTNS